MAGGNNEFGIFLRAYRLAYRLSRAHRAFIRMSEGGDGSILIECCPEGQVIKGNGFDKAKGIAQFYMWDESPEILDRVPDLVVLKRLRLKTPIRFKVGTDGLTIGPVRS